MGVFFSRSKAPGVPLDMENPEPTPEEQKVWSEVDVVLRQTGTMLQKIEEYKGCRELARKAMQSPTKENELEAFEGLLVSVDEISSFYNHSKAIEKVLPALLTVLRPHPDGKSTMSERQACSKQLALIFSFALRFDQIRMARPNLSNDFSYYRRLLPKFRKHPDIKIKDDDASGMALFTAEHIPIMNGLKNAAGRLAETDPHSTEVLSTLANSCMKLVKTRKYNSDVNELLSQAMTGAIVLYDMVDPNGAFSKKSPIAVKDCIMLLKKEFPTTGGPLLNAIQYSTKTFKNAPSSIKDLFD